MYRLVDWDVSASIGAVANNYGLGRMTSSTVSPQRAVLFNVAPHIVWTIDLILLTATLTNDRPVLSSERASHVDRTVTF
jgi:hypothetical protein